MRVHRVKRWAATAAATLLALAPAGSAGAREALAADGRQGHGCRAVTSLGRVEGVAQEGRCAFLGVPYAAAPTGANRFRPPRPQEPWGGTLRAVEERPGCPEDLGAGGEGVEDCLHLNVWAPRTGGGHKPVMVFLHGGAFQLDSAEEPVFDGGRMAVRGDAVVVNLDYRLGILGWTELGGLDPAYAGSGNNGLRDELAALEWVHRHVAAFGGNPADVTVFGQSAGAVSISAMLAGDHPERLFRRAVVQSGPGYLVHTAGSARRAAEHVFTTGGIHAVADLDRLTTREVLELQQRAQGGLSGPSAAVFFGPWIDGSLIPGPVVERVAAGSARHVEVMAGTTENETDFWALFNPSVLDLPLSGYRTFPAVLADRKQRMYDRYAANRPGLPEGRVVNAMLTDQTERIPTLRLAEAQSRWRPTYVYQFDWHVPYVPGLPAAQNLGAAHTLELPFVFGGLQLDRFPRGAQTVAEQRPALTRLSDRMMTAWTDFAHGDGPGWPCYTPDSRATRIWDLEPSVRYAPHDDERALWDGYDFPDLDF
ncbi:carboxylesterase/lipase family protein [Kitasatospora sp. NPDC059088]|uniref:carboxylesterase/lipase family protein n=1 Tax=Kitasatospora sp. NPDC059088 TaxID=3346722 RepID=UPI0036BAB19E